MNLGRTSYTEQQGPALLVSLFTIENKGGMRDWSLQGYATRPVLL